MEYIKIIIPFVEQKRKDLKLPPDQPALALFDVFKGQQTEEVATLLKENNILPYQPIALTISSRWI